MGAFVSSSEDEEEEEDQPKEQKQGPHGDSEHGENLVDTTESELRTITLKPVDRQNLNGKMLKLLSKRYVTNSYHLRSCAAPTPVAHKRAGGRQRGRGGCRQHTRYVINNDTKQHVLSKMNHSNYSNIIMISASAAPPLSYKSASCPKMIHLPQTNIALEKLPPLEPISSSVELPHGTPTKTTLYKVNNWITGRDDTIS